MEVPIDLFNRLCEESILSPDSGVPHSDQDIVMIKGNEQQSMEMGICAAHYLIKLVNVIYLTYSFLVWIFQGFRTGQNLVDPIENHLDSTGKIVQLEHDHSRA